MGNNNDSTWHRRSVIVRTAADGAVLDTVRIENDAVAPAAELAKAGSEADVAMECPWP